MIAGLFQGTRTIGTDSRPLNAVRTICRPSGLNGACSVSIRIQS